MDWEFFFSATIEHLKLVGEKCKECKICASEKTDIRPKGSNEIKHDFKFSRFEAAEVKWGRYQGTGVNQKSKLLVYFL